MLLKWTVERWQKFGLTPIVASIHWRDGGKYSEKLSTVLQLIDTYSHKGKVSLVGTSAGASLAFNAFFERKDTVHRVVNVCGRLRAGNHHWRSLKKMAWSSEAFEQSVLNFESVEEKLSAVDRQKIMTIRPFFGDELVPRDTAFLPGAHNRWIYTPEHVLSIYLSLRFARPIIEFLTGN